MSRKILRRVLMRRIAGEDFQFKASNAALELCEGQRDYGVYKMLRQMGEPKITDVALVLHAFNVDKDGLSYQAAVDLACQDLGTASTVAAECISSIFPEPDEEDGKDPK